MAESEWPSSLVNVKGDLFLSSDVVCIEADKKTLGKLK
jgi:hypothetical protein